MQSVLHFTAFSGLNELLDELPYVGLFNVGWETAKVTGVPYITEKLNSHCDLIMLFSCLFQCNSEWVFNKVYCTSFLSKIWLYYPSWHSSNNWNCLYYSMSNAGHWMSDAWYLDCQQDTVCAVNITLLAPSFSTVSFPIIPYHFVLAIGTISISSNMSRT